ncbi:glycosyltransferase family 2 protein [Cellulomonas hominis]|uniref:glycosyltransferase family 2 protein n=1 Tax=Cellulomonas hominis TaxID=156981 RepID=UPI001C0FED39|nr:glycosyltransferase family 2 protein [Cellulomonas hominis]MBU5424221.1 glycosyltransferase family 2 protein [Cellulomonas hominis]
MTGPVTEERAAAPRAAFAPPGAPVEVAAVVVTHRSAGRVGALLDSLRAEAAGLALRVVVVDNGSDDGTLDLVRAAYPDVVPLARGNLGYAGGINAAASHLGPCRAVLVLNPDLVVRPGAVAALLARLDAARAGVVVPRIEDEAGRPAPSLRREPALAAALVDAVAGSRWRAGRPAWSTETVLEASAYATAHPVDWATGAALLVDEGLADALGPWDERYFLYSEETEYCRRVRACGARVWFEPAATVVHAQGGSGASPRLAALLAVNRVRYVRAHHGRAYAAAFHGAVLLGEALRARGPGGPGHRAALRALLAPRTWPALAAPGASS